MKPSRFQTSFQSLVVILCVGAVTLGLASCAHLNDEVALDPFLADPELNQAAALRERALEIARAGYLTADEPSRGGDGTDD